MLSRDERRSPERSVQLAASLFLTIGLILQVWRIWTLNATYDQGLFLQEIWSGHLGRPFESTLASQLSTPVLVHGTALPGLGYFHLGQHFTPLLMVWLPLVSTNRLSILEPQSNLPFAWRFTSRHPISSGATCSAGPAKKLWGSAGKSLVTDGVAMGMA